jgi:ammonia channel protein AmtB
MVTVRFVVGWSVYNPGEVAGFDAEQSAALVKAGVAELVGAAVEVAAPANPPRQRRRG